MRFFSAMGWVGLVLLIILQQQGQLTPRAKAVIMVTLALMFLVQAGKGTMYEVYRLVLTIALAVWVGKGRIGMLGISLVLLGIVMSVTLRGVADDYRHVTWAEGQSFSFSERTAILGGIISDHVGSSGTTGFVSNGFERTTERSAVILTLADVIHRTPMEVPFWRGETYVSLVGAFVPRVLWPDKPTKELGQAFGHRYRYLGDMDFNTSYNLPWLIEAYANFGWAGIVVILFVVGMLYRFAAAFVNVRGQPLLTTAIGVEFLVFICHIESDFSLVFGGLFLQGAAFWLFVKLVSAIERNRLGDRRGTAVPLTAPGPARASYS